MSEDGLPTGIFDGDTMSLLAWNTSLNTFDVYGTLTAGNPTSFWLKDTIQINNGGPTLGTIIAGKVDKVTGKGLSTEDFTSAMKIKMDAMSGTNTGDQDLSALALKATTVNGHALSSNVIVTKSDVSLGNADNTSDANKPVSTATQTALNLKANTSALATVATSGAYADLTGKPSLATVATTGAYSDLTGKPTIPSATVDYYALTTKPVAKSVNNAPAPSLVTTAAAANGDRLSTFRDAEVSYSVSINTSISLGGNSSGYAVLEIAATNSTTATDWKEINRVSSGQSGTLVVGLTLNQIGGGNLSGIIPAGWYRRIRTVNVAGTPTYALTGSQEVLDEPLQLAA